MAWFRERRLRKTQSKLIAGTFMADQADTAQAGTVAEAAADGFFRVRCQRIVVPPPSSSIAV